MYASHAFLSCFSLHETNCNCIYLFFESWVTDVLMWSSSLEILTTVMSCADCKNIINYTNRKVSYQTLRPYMWYDWNKSDSKHSCVAGSKRGYINRNKYSFI